MLVGSALGGAGGVLLSWGQRSKLEVDGNNWWRNLISKEVLIICKSI